MTGIQAARASEAVKVEVEASDLLVDLGVDASGREGSEEDGSDLHDMMWMKVLGGG